MSASSVNTGEATAWAVAYLADWLRLGKTGSVTFHLHRGTVGVVELKERVTREEQERVTREEPAS